MIRKTLVTLALTAGMVAGTTGIASAHECFVAKRSDTGSTASTHSANWYQLQLSELMGHAHMIFGEPGDPALTPEQVDEAVAIAAASGVPTSFSLFERFTIPVSTHRLERMQSKSADGKGIDHFFQAYAERMASAYVAVVQAP